MKKQKLKLSIIAILGIISSFVLFYGGLAGTSIIASGCGGGSDNNDNTVPSGWSGKVYYCNPSANNSVATGLLHIEATCTAPLSGATGSTTMNENIPVKFTANLAFASSSGFTTAQIYKQGTWKITKVQIVGLSGLLTVNIPRTIQLPGSLGDPIFDFTGGSCRIQ